MSDTNFDFDAEYPFLRTWLEVLRDDGPIPGIDWKMVATWALASLPFPVGAGDESEQFHGWAVAEHARSLSPAAPDAPRHTVLGADGIVRDVDAPAGTECGPKEQP